MKRCALKVGAVSSKVKCAGMRLYGQLRFTVYAASYTSRVPYACATNTLGRVGARRQDGMPCAERDTKENLNKKEYKNNKSIQNFNPHTRNAYKLVC